MISALEVNTLAELPRVVCRHFEAKAAIVAPERALTYGELEQRSNAIANRLIAAGISREDRVAVLARDSVASIPLLFAAAKARAVWTGINWRLSADELAGIIDDAAPKIVFFDPEFAPALERCLETRAARPMLVALSAGQELGVTLEEWLGAAQGFPPSLTYDPDDVVVQLYTSGTTGLPKGVQLPNRSFFVIAQEMARKERPFLGWTSEDISLLAVPTFFVAALWWLVRGLALGGTNVVLPGFDPAQVLHAIERHRITKLGLVPAMLQMILAEPKLESTDLGSLRSILYGGSPIGLPLLERARARLGCDFHQAYGMTESGNLAVCLGPEDHGTDHPERLLSAGRPLPGVRVRVLRRDHSEAARGELGEIAIESPARMKGYWNKPEATCAVLVDGWIHTGDLGYIDSDGYIYVVDRIKDMIISAGENIFPAEIERVLRTHPAIADVAVIGIPHELWGEQIMAFAVPRPNAVLSARDVVQHARAHLATYKAPNHVEIVEQLPRNASGKVLKRTLRERFWQGRERQVN